MKKSEIRAHLLLRRSKLENKHQFNQSIISTIKNSSIWNQAHSVAIYIPFRHETDITELNTSHKIIYLPSIQKNEMQFQIWNKYTEFETLSYGLKQPKFIKNFKQDSIDLYLMPLVGFDMDGQRLGMGGGYYDRYFAQGHSGIRAGVAFQCQQHDSLPGDSWDVKIQHIFTEQGHHEF